MELFYITDIHTMASRRKAEDAAVKEAEEWIGTLADKQGLDKIIESIQGAMDRVVQLNGRITPCRISLVENPFIQGRLHLSMGDSSLNISRIKRVEVAEDIR